MPIIRICLALGGLTALLACPSAPAQVFVRDDIRRDPEPELFSVCHGNGCTSLSHVSLSAEEWRQVREIFFPLAKTAAEERERLRRAIALIERQVGAAIGTWQDKGGTFNGGEGQMDCIDESTNTTPYLAMLQGYGLMRHHHVEAPATRGWFFAGWPHTTAVIAEGGHSAVVGEEPRLWAVDSWFLDNSEPPFILPLEVWQAGWEPIK